MLEMIILPRQARDNNISYRGKTRTTTVFSGSALQIAAVAQHYGDEMFTLMYVSPVLENGCAVLGEVVWNGLLGGIFL
jgi:hypothetical protein